jgi:ABC-2 type transport system ATP-binding protein
MNENEIICLENISLDFPRQKKGLISIREVITKRVSLQPKREKWFRAIDGITMSVSRGEVIGIIGRNGSGKSTLLRMIAGIYAPDEGRIRVDGRVTLLSGVGAGFNNDLTGRENIKLSASIYGFTKNEIDLLEDAIIDFSGIRNFIDDPMRTYSTGMRARLGFAIISNLEPEILLLDEVMSVGDHDFRIKSRSRIEELVKGDTTVFIVSHSKAILDDLCHRVFAIDKGKIVTDGKIDTAFDFYQSEVA